MDDIRQQLNLLEKQRLRAVRGVRKLTAILNYVSAALELTPSGGSGVSGSARLTNRS